MSVSGCVTWALKASMVGRDIGRAHVGHHVKGEFCTAMRENCDFSTLGSWRSLSLHSGPGVPGTWDTVMITKEVTV